MLWLRSINAVLATAFALSMVFSSGCVLRNPINLITAKPQAVEEKPETQGKQEPEERTVSAQRPMTFLQNIGRTVEADPNKEYRLTEMEGPYLIFAAAFSGPNAQQDAHALALELRKTYKWNAFVYEKNFVFDAAKDLKQARNPYTGTRASYMNPGGESEFAVLIGNFSSLEDRQFEKTLDDVRKSQPESLKGKRSTMSIAMAFGLANPMLPADHQRGGVDTFIVSINKDRPYTLLRNPRRYTVQIATFTGHVIPDSVLNTLPVANAGKMSELEKGELAAAKLCKALRERGVEAYEFHDRYGSIVTVGSFDQYEQRLPNGAVQYHPVILQIIQQYQGQVTGNSYKPVIIDGVECDLLPRVIEVPRPR